MKKLIVSAFLASIAIAISVSVVYAQPREEIRLTTIIPDQQVLRVKKGIVSTTNYKQATFPDSNIPASSLIVEGNVGIGTTNPRAKLEVVGGVKIANDADAPSAVKAGTMRYNAGVMQYCDGTTWSPLGGGAAYVSDWRYISRGANVTFNHNLGTDQLSITIQFKPTINGTICMASDSNYGGSGYGSNVTVITSTDITVSGGDAGVDFWKLGGQTGPNTESGYVRILVKAVN